MVDDLGGDPEDRLDELVLGLLHVDRGRHWLRYEDLRSHVSSLITRNLYPAIMDHSRPDSSGSRGSEVHRLQARVICLCFMGPSL